MSATSSETPTGTQLQIPSTLAKLLNQENSESSNPAMARDPFNYPERPTKEWTPPTFRSGYSPGTSLDDPKYRPSAELDVVMEDASGPSTSRTAYSPNTSIFLIGMRGVGKTTLGLIAATALNRRFIDADAYLEESFGQPVRSFVASHGWLKFRQAEFAALRAFIERFSDDTVISCGGGVVETPEARALLESLRGRCPVIYVIREEDSVLDYLNTDPNAMPNWREGVRDVWRRREPWFRQCSSHSFASLTTHNDVPNNPLVLKSVEQSFLRLCRAVLSPPHLDGATMKATSVLRQRVNLKSRTSLLSTASACIVLARRKLREVDPATLRAIVSGVDAIYLRADVLDCLGTSDARVVDWSDLAVQVAAVQYACPDVPIIFSLRTIHHGGLFDDRIPNSSERNDSLYFAILQFAVTLGVSVVEIEIDRNPKFTLELMSLKGPTQILLTAFDRPESPASAAWAAQVLTRATQLGADMLMLSSRVRGTTDLWRLLAMQSESLVSAAANPSIPLVLVDSGIQALDNCAVLSKFSPLLAFVGHRDLPREDGFKGTLPGVQERQESLVKSGFIPKSINYVVDSFEYEFDPEVGGNVSAELAHFMRASGLVGSVRWDSKPTLSSIRSNQGHPFHLFDTDILGGELQVGGAIVLQEAEQKEAFSLVEEVGEAGRELERCSAISFRRTPQGVTIVGDNTLPRSIATVIRAGLSPINCVSPKTTALLVSLPSTQPEALETRYMASAAAMALRDLGIQRVGVFGPEMEGIERFHPGLVPVVALSDEAIGTAFPSPDRLPSVVVVIADPDKHQELLRHQLPDLSPPSPSSSAVHLPAEMLTTKLGGTILFLSRSGDPSPLRTSAVLSSGAPNAPLVLGKGWVLLDSEHIFAEETGRWFEGTYGVRAPYATYD